MGVYTSASDSTVGYTVWSNDAWSVPAPINASAVAMGQPFIDATGTTTAHLTYQDKSFYFWYLAYASGAWSATPQSLNVFGPVPATIAANGPNAIAAFIDGRSGNYLNFAAEADLMGGVWQSPVDVAGPESFQIPAVIVPLSAGGDLMMIFVRQDTQIMYATRSSMIWSPAAPIANCLTADRVALSPLPNDGAILAFRGIDSPPNHYLYWSVYSSGTWSSVAPFTAPNVPIDTSPAVAHGVGGDTAEMAYLSGGVAYHARLSGSTWSAPVMVGGANLTGVALAATP